MTYINIYDRTYINMGIYIYTHIRFYVYMNLPVKRGVYAFNLFKTASSFFSANQEILRRCNGMAGGVLLAAALVHLLPDAQKVRGLRGPSLLSKLRGVGAFGVYCFLVLLFEVWGDFCYVSKFFVNIFLMMMMMMMMRRRRRRRRRSFISRRLLILSAF